MCDNGQYTYVYYITDNPKKNVVEREFTREKDNISISSEKVTDSENHNKKMKTITILGLLWTIFTKL